MTLRPATLALLLCSGLALAVEPYQKPPKEILDVLHAPLPPGMFLSPPHADLILGGTVRYPPISELARPFMRLGGVRVIARSRALHAATSWSSYTLLNVATGAQRPVLVPAGAKLGAPRWNADGTRFAFTNTTPDAVELWVGELRTAKARKVEGVRLNPMLGAELQWLADQKTLLIKHVPKGQGAPPPSDAAPVGPNVQESSGQTKVSSTYEVRDVLTSPADEALFDFYGASQLATVDAQSLKVTPVGVPGLLANVQPSPDGTLILVETVRRPYSYLTTNDRFGRDVEVWTRAGQAMHHLVTQPLADAVPIWGERTGPRNFEWRPTEPATLTWAEVLDEGDWKKQVPFRDRVLMQPAPFTAEPMEIARTQQRFSGFQWTEDRSIALLRETDAIKHWARTFVVDVDHPTPSPRLLWDLSTDERYKFPGYPIYRVLPSGQWVIELTDGAMTLTGPGPTPEGERPFLDRLDLAKNVTTRLFLSGPEEYESFFGWVDHKAGVFLTRHESPTDPPNLFVRTLEAGAKPLTHFTDAAPSVRGITKKLVKYKRADGVDLSFTLYLPPNYQPGTKLPTIVWAYPLDFADPKMAGQVTGSTQRFTILGWPLHLFMLLEGYAVIDNPSLPVVGDVNRIYDTYMEQLVSGAKAAVDTAVAMGVTDPERIGITGHSHGGLMTVNLLAHSDLFRAGVARSGAYNRSLTAFGFQNERRTLWEAPEVYSKVSPFFHADQVKLPLLLIHGAADANPGTVPLQSEKLYEAVRANGGTVRLVMLPNESHIYAGMESTEQVLWEMVRWFDTYVKNAPPRKK